MPHGGSNSSGAGMKKKDIDGSELTTTFYQYERKPSYTVDWGDGSETSALVDPHTFAKAGIYTVKIELPEALEISMDMRQYFIDSFNGENGTKGVANFDTWGSPERAYLFALLRKETLIKVVDTYYFCTYSEGQTRGMGSYPDMVAVQQLDFGAATIVKLEE